MLDGKVCVVTGGAQGIGRETAIQMALRGARVAVADRDLDAATATVRAIEDAGGHGMPIACDVTDRTQLEEAMAAADAELGAIDVLHNNAGITESNAHGASTVETLPDEMFDRVLDVNLRGTWWATRAALPYLKRSSRNPAIVNASSVGGLLAVPNSAAYCASKAAIINLTRSMAMDLAEYGIRCNSYCPGSIRTPMIDGYVASAGSDSTALSHLTSAQLIDRLGEPREVADLVCFLASDQATFITGSNITIDGGKLAWRGIRAP